MQAANDSRGQPATIVEVQTKAACGTYVVVAGSYRLTPCQSIRPSISCMRPKNGAPSGKCEPPT